MKKRSRLKTLALLAGGALLFLGFALGGLHGYLAYRIHQEENKLRAAGEPVTLDDLIQRYPPLPPHTPNAADIYQKAFDALVEWDENNPLFKDLPYFSNAEFPHYTQNLNPSQLRALEQHGKVNKQSLELLAKAQTITICRFPLRYNDGYLMEMNHFGNLRNLALLLQGQLLRHLFLGNNNAAQTTLRQLWHLPNSLDHEPLLISHLVRLALNHQAISGLELFLTCQPLPSEQRIDIFQSVTVALAKENDTLREILLSERAFILSGFQNDVFDNSAEAIETLKLFGDDNENSLPPFYRLSGLRKCDHLLTHLYINRIINAMQLPPIKRDLALQEIRETVESKPRFLQPYTKMMALSLAEQNWAYFLDKQRALHRMLITVLSIEHYREKNGTLPERLNDLIPSYLDQLPLDPFDGQPLRYLKLAKGFRVYSVGPDGQDDGGKEAAKPGDAPRQPWFEGSSTFDYTFTVAR